MGIVGFALLTAACGSSVKELDPLEADEDGVQRRQFRIECVQREQCQREAQRACGSTYRVVSEWHNTIPESDLPGLNEQSRPKSAVEEYTSVSSYQTGIESKDPMPLTSLVIACNG